MLKEDILKESNRCLNCLKKPCHSTCPLNNDPALFISEVKKENFKEAYNILCEETCLPSICGRICPHEKQCGKNCTKGRIDTPIDIGSIEAYIGDMAIQNNWPYPNIKDKNDKKIAIIGGGPSGLTCAYFLAKEGYNITIYDKHKELGGILRYGIPDFRLDKSILDKTINKLLSLGIEFIPNYKFNDLNKLIKQYDAIYLAIGSNKSYTLDLPNENLKGIYGGNELLEYNMHPDYHNKVVAIVGGGNVATDASRVAKKMGAKKVYIIYRRTEDKMPASKKEIADCYKEGIEFIFETKIEKIIGENNLEKLELVKTKPNDNGIPESIPNSNFELEVDYLINCLGSHPEEDIIQNLNIKLENNYIKTNNYLTSNPKVFAGGDIIGTTKTVAYAANDGKLAAKEIIKYLGGE